MPALAAVGSNSSTSYVAEVLYGVTPTSPTMKALRSKIGTKFDFKRDTFQSKEASATRQVQGLSYGNSSGTAEVPFELSYGSYDDFLEAVMGGTWAGNVLKVGNTKRSFSMEQSWPDINLQEQNSGVVMTGLSLGVKPGAIVEGSFSAMFKNQSFGQYADDGVTTMAFAATTITRSAGSFITDGFTNGDSVTITGASVGVNNRSISTPAVITTLTATVMTCSAAAFTVDTAKTGVTISKTLGTPTAANTNPVFDSFTGSISVDGAVCAIVTGIDLKLDQGASGSNVVFDATIQQVSLQTVNVTGTITVRFINNALKRKYLNGSSTDFSFTLGATSKMYRFDMSSSKLTSVGADNGEGELTQTLAYQAVYDTGDASTLIITRTP